MATASAESLGNVLALSATVGQHVISFAPTNALTMVSAWRGLACAWQVSWAWIALCQGAAVGTEPATTQELVCAIWAGMGMTAQRSSCVPILAARGMAPAQVAHASAPQVSQEPLVHFKAAVVAHPAATMVHATRSRTNVSAHRVPLAPHVCQRSRPTVRKIAITADSA